ncbi:hypothetical protein F8388_024108 [Cannabis sativa]|uniref:Uncharacterized protein n=1 Tax=Cannabis sativa TaxID=3483 RepID=A0A7J6G0B2_CANSA|nr:hypothetical protein F8388_024108 [Cannabis sativa]KAF4383429.1 hypothetical protein G4B88_024003 [Cannabis sativa]
MYCCCHYLRILVGTYYKKELFIAFRANIWNNTGSSYLVCSHVLLSSNHIAKYNELFVYSLYFRKLILQLFRGDTILIKIRSNYNWISDSIESIGTGSLVFAVAFLLVDVVHVQLIFEHSNLIVKGTYY